MSELFIPKTCTKYNYFYITIFNALIAILELIKISMCFDKSWCGITSLSNDEMNFMMFSIYAAFIMQCISTLFGDNMLSIRFVGDFLSGEAACVIIRAAFMVGNSSTFSTDFICEWIILMQSPIALVMLFFVLQKIMFP